MRRSWRPKLRRRVTGCSVRNIHPCVSVSEALGVGGKVEALVQLLDARREGGMQFADNTVSRPSDLSEGRGEDIQRRACSTSSMP